MSKSETVLLTINEYVAGIFAGFTQVIFGQPFDTIKVRLQTTQHKSIWSCINLLKKTEGISALFKGTLAPLVGTGFLVSIEMGTNQVIKTLMKGQQSEKLVYKQIFLSGALAGLIGCTISTPVQHGKIRMQCQTTQKYYRGSVHAIYDIYKRYGIRAVYKGFQITLLREVIPTGCYFLTYEIGKRNFKTPNEIKFSQIGPIGAAAGLIYWLLGYPFDLIKTRIQHDSLQSSKYVGIQGVLKGLREMKNEGFQYQRKGFDVCMMRAIPVYAINFYCYQQIIRILSETQHLTLIYQ